jgi:hypothetical protein
MVYSQRMDKSAHRHLAAADVLHDEEVTRPTKCRAVAGYLYGVAAECALKQIMRDSGMRPLDASRRHDDPYYAHFPHLKTMLRDVASGRRAGELQRYANDAALMSEWSTDMRYAPANDVEERWITRWKEQARMLVGIMEGA